LSRRARTRVARLSRRAGGIAALCLLAGVIAVCSRAPRREPRDANARDRRSEPPETAQDAGAPAHEPRDAAQTPAPPSSCADGRAMTVRFYDVGQGLAVLVELPDGRHVLVDTGDEPRRSGCGEPCATASAHLLSSLRADLHGAPIDLLWLTHPHSDHIGGAPAVLEAFPVGAFVDDGRDARRGEVRRARRAAEERGVPVHVVEPGNAQVPLASSAGVRLTAVVPAAWPPACARDPNECSIGLRIDDCASSVLLLGDAEHAEEARLDPGGPVTLLQVAHHGSETSTSLAFLARARPRYAVVSAGKVGEGMNREYCHPRALIVRRLSRALGGPTTGVLASFDGDRCDRATPDDWVDVPTSERLWATERDGDVVLTTTGDGVFRRVGPR
jgi:competence protein ComEC